jgi:acetoin utilization deacetylase AcuC-like enzyme
MDHRPLHEWGMGEKSAHPETHYRAESILKSLTADSSAYRFYEPEMLSLSLVRKVHSPALFDLYQTAQKLNPGQNISPSVFPKRHIMVADPTDIHHAGYFCSDSATPLMSKTYEAALFSASSAQDASMLVESGKSRVAYALCRPPGHHAQKDLFGGYCYFNNAAIIAKRMRAKGKVVILDIDFHHGNGTQEIFWQDDQVLFISLHGDPKEFYPHFTGYEHEDGEGKGKGFTANFPLGRGCDGSEYLKVLQSKVFPMIRKFDPASLVISAGFDTYHKDPLGGFALQTADFNTMGEMISNIGLPTVIVQEGGYHVDDLGLNVEAFLRGISHRK